MAEIIPVSVTTPPPSTGPLSTGETVLPSGGQNNTMEGSKENAVKEAAKEAIRRHKLKVDGQEIEVDDNELKRGYAHQTAANKRMQEALATRKQAEEFVTMMRQPELFYEAAQKLGHNPRELAEKYLAAQLEDELADPRDIELRKTKQQLKMLEDMQNKQKEDAERQQQEILKKKYAEDYTKQFVAALQTSGLPPTKEMVGKMAYYVQQGAKMGFKMNVDEAAKLVREDVQIAHQKLLGEADEETLIKLLGDGVANKIRKYDVARLKSPEDNLKTPAPKHNPFAPRIKDGSAKRMTVAEWNKFNGRL